ncbi:MAG: glycosyltransferase, partial [Candidatus Delongbacteria bacterium]
GILTPVCDGKYRDADIPLTKEEILLADAVKHLLKDSKMHKKYSEKGKTRAIDFGSEKIIREYVKVIEGIH